MPTQDEVLAAQEKSNLRIMYGILIGGIAFIAIPGGFALATVLIHASAITRGFGVIA